MSRTTPLVFRDCHRLRRHLRDLQGEVDLGPRVLKKQQEQLAAAEAAHKEAHETLRKLKLKLKDDELSLKTTETQLAKFQADINNATSKKEFDAKTNEIAMATARKGEFEDAILAGMGAIEERTAELPQVDATWKAAEGLFAEQQREAKERLARLLADKAATEAKLAEVEKEIPAEIRGHYDRLVKRYGADGLAGVAGRTCQQCRTDLTEQNRTSLLSGAYMCCPQCGRALYLAE